MKFSEFLPHGFLLTLVLSITSIHAQTAPGEDPVQLTEKVTHNMLPLNTVTQPAGKAFQEIPAWMDAKLARFTAKAFSIDTTGIVTDESVATSLMSDGIRKVCTQEIGSNVASLSAASNARLGIAAPQAVVLRGDLINICR
jgi:hypothetical protein